MWRSCVALLISLPVLGWLVYTAVGGLSAGSSLHDWGRPQSAPEGLAQLAGMWAQDPPLTDELAEFSALYFEDDQANWYTFTTLEGKVTNVHAMGYDIAYEPNSLPRRMKLNPLADAKQDPKIQPLFCVYTVEGDTLKIWLGSTHYPRPNGESKPHFRMKRIDKDSSRFLQHK